MKRFAMKLVLGIAGTLLLVIGSAVLFTPEAFSTANGVALGQSASALSEYRAPGGMLIVSALIVLLGAVRERFMQPAFAVAALVYCSYGFSRLVGVASDGLPSEALTQAMAIELSLGAICLTLLLRLNGYNSHD